MTDTDRDKYCVNRIIDFYKRQPIDYADYFLAAWRYRHRAALRRPRMTLADVAAEARVSPKYLATVWAMLTARRRRRRPARGAAGTLAKPAAARAITKSRTDSAPAVERMRDFVVGLRPRVALAFENLPARGIAAGSQPLVLWKNRQYADQPDDAIAGNALRARTCRRTRRPIAARC